MSEIVYLEGRITKGIGGFYYVDTADGIFECRARGSFRKDGIVPLVGDMVKISVNSETMTGAVDEIMPRSTVLLRPPVANVTQTAIVISTANPRPNLYLTDKLLAAAAFAETNILLLINKTDLDDGGDICSVYKNIGYDVIMLSAETGENIDSLRERLCDSVTVFAGNSGVGKSSLLNAVIGETNFETGEVSRRAERGKHTTRHSELVRLASGGYIIDTPGFGSLDFSLLNAENCAELFPEFEPHISGCRFSDCSHTVEAGCAVLEALAEGRIAPSRHESYTRLVSELREARKR